MLHQIGAGTLGPVFRAFDQETERLVAVKLFTTDLAPERVHQLVAEFERLISATLTHPGIAAPLAAGIRDNHAYLAMEYVSGDSLDVAVRQYGAAPPAEALRVAAQLAGALDFAAVVNVAHGALHPRDVLLSADETRLTGLGIAHAFEAINIAAPVRRPYTPPEGIAGAEWDRRADVFSLAALMHELLWGRRVSAIGARVGESLTDVAGGDLEALRALFARALAERPADRFDTALDFAQALTQAFPGVAIAAPRAHVDDAASPTAETAVEIASPPLRDEPAAPIPPPPVKNAGRVRPQLPAAAVASPRREPEAAADSAPQPVEARGEALDPVDLDLREAEGATADVSPLSVDGSAAGELPVAAVNGYADAPISALERSRSALWPLALALVVGVAIGFASGYGVGSRDRSTSPQIDASASPTAAARAPAAPAAREGTGGVVADKTADAKPAAEKPTAEKPAETAAASAAAEPDAGRRASVESPKATAGSKPEIGSKAEIGGLKSEIAVSGRLLVRSTPAGARVFVDGREQGQTPVAVRELARGEHRIRIVRDGYATEERRVTLTASQPAQAMTVPLVRAHVAAPAVATPVPETPGTAGRFVGALSVDSRPSGAKVFIDGALAGNTPLQLAGLNAGEHLVRIERDGYRRWSSSVRVVAYEHNRVTASLEK